MLRKSTDDGSGTGTFGGGGGCGVGVGVDVRAIGVGVEAGVSGWSPRSMKKSGIAAKNRNGHFGNPPPTMKISPQSQIVP